MSTWSASRNDLALERAEWMYAFRANANTLLMCVIQRQCLTTIWMQMICNKEDLLKLEKSVFEKSQPIAFLKITYWDSLHTNTHGKDYMTLFYILFLKYTEYLCRACIFTVKFHIQSEMTANRRTWFVDRAALSVFLFTLTFTKYMVGQ